MKAIKRLFAVLLSLLGVAGLVLCVGGVVGVFIVKKPLQERTTRLLKEAGQSLQTAADGVDVVHESLLKAREELKQFSRKPDAEHPKPTFVDRVVAEHLESNVKNIGATVNVVADASVVLNSLLGSLNEIADTGLGQIDTDRLKDVQGGLSDLTRSSHRLSVLLGDQKGNESAEQAAQMLDGLDRVIVWLDELQGKIKTIQGDVTKLQSRTPGWIQMGSIVLPAVLVWMALSQLTMIGFACWWFRRQSEDDSGSLSGGLAARIR